MFEVIFFISSSFYWWPMPTFLHSALVYSVSSMLFNISKTSQTQYKYIYCRKANALNVFEKITDYNVQYLRDPKIH